MHHFIRAGRRDVEAALEYNRRFIHPREANQSVFILCHFVLHVLGRSAQQSVDATAVSAEKRETADLSEEKKSQNIQKVKMLLM